MTAPARSGPTESESAGESATRALAATLAATLAAGDVVLLHGDPVAHRHRLNLVVGHVDGGDTETLL